jgi:hypothetical protein
MTTHTKDSDCTIDPETDCCLECFAWHAEPCRECGGRAYHNHTTEKPRCPECEHCQLVVAENLRSKFSRAARRRGGNHNA